MQPTVEPPPPPTYEDEEEQVEEPPKAVPPPSTPLSDDELNAMFAEPEPVESLVDEEEDKEEDEDEPEPENYPDPDPIPQVFTDPSSVLEDEERPVSVLLVVLAALLVIAGLLGGLYFARDGVMKIVPATRAVYDLIGLAGERLGVGLEIRNIDFERETENNIDVLVVRGSIVNTDKQLRPIPYIRVVLYDSGANALQDMVMPPLESELMPGKDVGFRARFVDPSPLARRVEVTFAEPPAKPAP